HLPRWAEQHGQICSVLVLPQICLCLGHDIHPAGIDGLARHRLRRRWHLLHRAWCSPGPPHTAADPVRLISPPESVTPISDINVTVPQEVCTQFVLRDYGLPVRE
ncbi:MAG: hypothetical protein ACK53Y_18150, partial [bacterium]